MDGMRITYPLDKNAVKVADRTFYERYPEMIDAQGKPIPIDPANPAHQSYVKEWKQLYINAGGPAVSRSTNVAAANEELPEPACQCEWVELVHITGDQDQVYCLTQKQLEALIQAEQEVIRPIIKLHEAIQSDQENIVQVKTEIWQELKQLGVLPSGPVTRPNLLKQMEAELELARERYWRKKKRYDSLEQGIRRLELALRIRGEMQVTQNFFRRHLKDLTTDLLELKTSLPALKQEFEFRKQLVKLEKARNQVLWRVVEAEVDYRVAKARSKEFSAEELVHKHLLAQVLAAETQLTHYVSQEEVEELVRIALRLREIEEEQSRLRAPLVESGALETLLAIASSIGSITGRAEEVRQLGNRSRESYGRYLELWQALSQEKESLLQRQQKIREDFVGRPPLQSPYANNAMPTNKLIEIKRSGAGGFRYIHRDALEDLRQQWARISMDQVKKALHPNGIKGAARRAGQELARNIELKLNFAKWDSREDNFFNLLHIELFKFDLDNNKDPRYENFSLNAEAQMFRFVANAEVYASDMLRSAQRKNLHLGGKMQASYSILEAKAQAGVMIPSSKGWPLRLSYQGQDGHPKELELGCLRCQANYSIQGFAGACVMLAAEVEANTEPGAVILSGKTKGEAFAGASLKNEASFLVEWSKPEDAAAEDGQAKAGGGVEFKELLKVVPSFAISFGIGLAFDWGVGLQEGKLVLYLKGHLVLGPGGGGGVAAELNVDHIIELIKFVRLALERSDFRFQEWISKEAFEHISWIMRLVALGNPLSEIAGSLTRELKEKWQIFGERQQKTKELAQSIMVSNELDLCTPEAKASLLHVLTEKFVWSTKPVLSKPSTWFDGDEEQAIACMRILDTVTSRRELVEILYRMKSPDGQPGDIKDYMDSYRRLFNSLLFKSGQREQAIMLLRKLNRE